MVMAKRGHGKASVSNAGIKRGSKAGMPTHDFDAYADYFGNKEFSTTDEIFNSDMWTRETVIRDENNGLSLYDEVVAALSVPKSGLRMYDKNKRGDFALRQTQKNLIQAEKFTLTDNFVRMAVALSFSYPRYIAQLIPKAIPCFDNLWIEWDELVRFDALQEEFKKLDLLSDGNRSSVANRIGYHVQRENEGFSYNFFICDAVINKEGTKRPKKVDIGIFEWMLLNSKDPLTHVEDPYWFFGLGTTYSKFHRNDEGMGMLNNFSKNFRFRQSAIAPALWKPFADGDVSKKDPDMYNRLKETGGHSIDGDARFLTAVFSLLNYPRYVRATLPPPKKVSTIRWGRRVPKSEVKVVEIDLPKRGVNVYGQLFTGHGSPKRQHVRRAHPRHYRDKFGKVTKIVWIEPTVCGDESLGVINHEYVLQVKKDRKEKSNGY
tara:strand:- start:33 stop:1331 length:1299 start_codon:yes stop_codon:yes gene_type:complete